MKNENAQVGFGLWTVLLGVLVAGCGGPSTTFVTSWRSPKAEPIKFRGEPVAAVVMVENEITRKNAEDALAREITYYGAKGIALYTIMAADPESNEAAARKAIEAAGIKGVVVMRPKGKRTKTETSESYYGGYYDPMYSSYWGGYHGYGWGMPWSYARGGLPTAGPMPPYGYGTGYGYSSPGGTTKTTTTTEVVVVEVLVYSLKQNMLAWAGESESTPPEKVDEFVVQVAAEAAKELGDKGLLSSK